MRLAMPCLLLALAPVLAPAAGGESAPPASAAAPTCAAVPRALYGLSLEAAGYPGSPRAGLAREGTAQVVEGVGFESLQGQSDGVRYPRIMAFFDRGRFTRIMAVGRVPADRDQGFAHLVATVAGLAGTPPRMDGGRAVFSCEGALELTVEPTDWDGGAAVRIGIGDRQAQQQTRAYIAEYCADPQRRRPQDACAK